MEKLYKRTYWKNAPDKTTPVNAVNLDNIEAGIDGLDDRVIELKSDLSQLDNVVVTNIDLSNVTKKEGYRLSGYNESTDSASYITDFIKVEPLSKVRITGAYLTGNRCISGYNISKWFAVELVRNYTEDSVVIDVPKNCHYLRITGQIGKEITAEYLGGNALQNDNIKDKLFKKEELSFVVTHGYYLQNNGELKSDNSKKCTDFIEVYPHEIIITKPLVSPLGVLLCEYDKNKIFIKSHTATTTPETYTFAPSENCKYIRVNLTHSDYGLLVETTLKYTNPVYRFDELTEEKRKQIIVDKTQFEEGKLLQPYPSVENTQLVLHTVNEGYCISPKVYVDDDCYIVLENFVDSKRVGVYFFDTLGEVIEKTSGGFGTSHAREVVYVPKGTKYIMYTVLSSQLESNAVSYLDDDTVKNEKELDFVRDFMNCGINVGQVFRRCKKPILTVIDDDTTTPENVKAFKDACDEVGVKGTFAVWTNKLTLEGNEGLTERLLGYENEGFNMVFHSKVHTEDYKADHYDMTDETYARFETDLVQGLREMQDAGFVDFRHWVTPFGIHNYKVRKLAIKYGMSCIVCSSSSTYETMGSRWAIKRLNIDSDSSTAWTTEELKEFCDKAYDDNGWLILCSHFGYTDYPVDKWKEVVAYAKAKGFEVCTLNEAIRRRKPIYDLYDMF